MRRAWLTLGFLLSVIIFAPAGPHAQWKTKWTYEGATGAEHWGDLDPEYAACNNGKEQSPIDIQDTRKTTLPPLQFKYRSSPLKYLINNGYTIRVNYHDAADAGNFLLVGDRRYQLTQFHFHRPSEEYLHGKPYDMEVHLMHQSNDGKIAGVTVLLKAGRANPTVQQIWDHMPKNEGKEQEIAGVNIDPTGLLPHNTASYFTYMGSVTAPPCTEGVAWYVLKTPIEISPEQIAAFAELYPHDVRPLQPLNRRIVKESQ